MIYIDKEPISGAFLYNNVVYLQLNTEHGAVHSSAGAGAAVILAQLGHLELR